MFGHQDEEQATVQSAATAPVATSDDSGYQLASDSSQTASNDNNDDYLNNLASETLDHEHPEASETTSPTVHDASGVNISNNDFASGDSDASDTDDTNGDSDDNNTDAADKENSDATIADDQLLDIKQQALQQLSPLVDHLDQTPEEKFKTTMMMIQAADNQSLIPDAYKAAKEIGDEKARAQALLDIVNEINYFTHKS